MNFREFFSEATGGRVPYPFQERFAEADSLPHLVRAPTGAGKTATAILGWLYRQQHQVSGTPRRLVYCLPMRVLVEQSEQEARAWLENLKSEVKVHVLMGGVDTEQWYLHPEKPAVLIGTQDMLLSRALNRGYAASRFRWPIDFGLLNNDCLWIFDEPQLMANGVATSAQLAGLRKSLGVTGECLSVWMSATLERSWLDTVDFSGKFTAAPLELSDADYNPKLPLHKRMTAAKTLAKLDAASSKDMKDVAKAVHAKHVAGTQTLVIVNTVDRAKSVYEALQKERKKSETPKLLLVHSRFRLHERESLMAQLQDKGEATKDRIIVSTQVVEAGVDISSRTLVTELCPWSSAVQRMGRCVRTGDDGPGQVYWIDLNEKLAPPYLATELDFSRTQLEKLNGKDVSPKSLDEFKVREKIDLPFEHKHVLRCRDLLDLFDTTSDLSGNDIDIQRFVRSDDPDTDVQAFWRDIAAEDWEVSPVRRELCNVPVGSIKSFLKKDKVEGYRWDHLDDRWELIRSPDREVFPGQKILLSYTAGGYSIELGWDPETKSEVTAIPSKEKVLEEGFESDLNSAIPVALTIAQHTSNVCDELGALLKQIGVTVLGFQDNLMRAARWHDVGKAHEAFQTGIRAANSTLAANELWAKSGKTGRLTYSRRYFRHELASALAALQYGVPFDIAYSIAAHHGRSRLAIRAMPDEDQPADSNTLFALGVHHGDTLPEVDLGNELSPAVTLDLSPMQLGGDSSWTANALKLLAEFGPFKLAYLEALLRAADVRASKKEAGRA